MIEFVWFCDAQKHFLTLFSIILPLFCVRNWLKIWNCKEFKFWYLLGVKMWLMKDLQVCFKAPHENFWLAPLPTFYWEPPPPVFCLANDHCQNCSCLIVNGCSRSLFQNSLPPIFTNWNGVVFSVKNHWHDFFPW